MPFEYIDEQPNGSKFEYIDEPTQTTPEKKVGFFGSVPESAYNRGERNIVGNIFERPGAAIRSALMGKGYTAGALNPANVPKFQDVALNAYYNKLPNFPGKTMLGNIPSAAGLAADILTEPSALIPTVAGMSPTIRGAAKAIGATDPAQAFARFLNKERSVADVTKHFPKLMTDNWLVNRAKTVKLAVDEAVTGVRKEFASIFEPHKKLAVSSDTLNAIPKTLLDDMGIKKDTATVGQLWDARDNLLTQISDATWNKSETLKRLKLKESDLMDSVSKLKAAVLNSVPKETRNTLLKLDPKYTEIINLGKELSSKVYKPSTNTYKTSSLVNVYSNPKSSDARVAFKQFQKYNDKIGQVTKDIKKYVGRQTFKKFAAATVGTGLVLGGLSLGLRRKIAEPLENLGE